MSHGCWLHYPGFCIDGEGWDENYRTVARVNVMEGNQLRIRTECVPFDESVDAIDICCEEMQEGEGVTRMLNERQTFLVLREKKIKMLLSSLHCNL